MQTSGIDYEQAKAAEKGTIFHDSFEDGLRFIVMRGPCAFTAYVGIGVDHPLADHSYDDLPVRAHGGLTFAGSGGKEWPAGYFWYGWDYGHCGDRAFYDEIRRDGDKEWDVSGVVADSWETLYDFGHLLKLSEAIHNRAMRKPRAGQGPVPSGQSSETER